MSLTLAATATSVRGETISTDIAVIGSGAAGMVAALTAREGGAKVIVFEKMRFPGGTSNFAEGIFAVESEMQGKALIRITRDEAFKMIMEYNHWRANARLIRAFVDESAATIQWLQRQGVEFIGPESMWPDGPRTTHLLKGLGAAMMKTLVGKAKDIGVEIRTTTTVKKILKEGGRITGIVAEGRSGHTVRVEASAVIIATGGYANNKEWIKKYTGLDLGVNLFPFGNVGKMGEGIEMAWEVGAGEDGLGLLQLVGGSPVGPGIRPMGHLTAAVAQPNLWINQRGERFCDENVTYNFSYAGNVVARQDGQYFYSVFDESLKKYWIEKGIDKSLGAFMSDGTRLVNFDQELKEALEKGNPNVFVANSLEELAKKMGVDSKAFIATVEEYNRFCETNHDGLFAKNPRSLQPVKGPKFYGLRCFNNFLGTLGGIRINHKTEVLDKERDVIPGLYAVGNDAGGVYGDTYDLYSAGGTLGFAVNSGRIAGRNALIHVGK